MKVVVTGGAGFIGSHVVDLLVEKKHDVIVFDDFSSGRLSNLSKAQKISKENGTQLEIYQQSIKDKNSWLNLPKADAVFHFAAQTSVTASFDNPQKDFELNAQSILYLFEWIKKNKPKHCLFANTAGALYGDTEIIPTPENIPLFPDCLYGATKCFGETYIHAYTKSLKASGFFSNEVTKQNYFSWVSLRLANVYGERQITKGEAGVIPIFTDMFSKAKAPVVFGESKVTRDYVHVSDVANAFILAFEKLQSQCLDTSFNIGTGKETSSEEVYKLVFESFKNTKYFEKISTFQTPKRSPLRPGEVTRSCLNTDKAQKILNWKNSREFSKNVKFVVDYYLSNEIADN